MNRICLSGKKNMYFSNKNDALSCTSIPSTAYEKKHMVSGIVGLWHCGFLASSEIYFIIFKQSDSDWET